MNAIFKAVAYPGIFASTMATMLVLNSVAAFRGSSFADLADKEIDLINHFKQFDQQMRREETQAAFYVARHLICGNETKPRLFKDADDFVKRGQKALHAVRNLIDENDKEQNASLTRIEQALGRIEQTLSSGNKFERFVMNQAIVTCFYNLERITPRGFENAGSLSL